MTETQWTPGPWCVSHFRSDGKRRANILQDTAPLKRILMQPGTWFFDDDTDSEEFVEFEANMALMAASPDLYEALAEVRAEFGYQWPDDFKARVDAALSKARGE